MLHCLCVSRSPYLLIQSINLGRLYGPHVCRLHSSVTWRAIKRFVRSNSHVSTQWKCHMYNVLAIGLVALGKCYFDWWLCVDLLYAPQKRRACTQHDKAGNRPITSTRSTTTVILLSFASAHIRQTSHTFSMNTFWLVLGINYGIMYGNGFHSCVPTDSLFIPKGIPANGTRSHH